MTKALIDADGIVYAAGFSTQKKVDGIVQTDPVHFAYHNAKVILTKMLDVVQATEYKLYLTSADQSNFRFNIAKTQPYKGNRLHSDCCEKRISYQTSDLNSGTCNLCKMPCKAVSDDKPIHYSAIREYLVNRWGANLVYTFEADDKLAMSQTESTVICSFDKDLLQVPGNHYNWRTGVFKSISETEGWRSLFKQVLTGDTADHIPGIPRYGPVAAKVYIDGLNEPEAMYERVFIEYLKNNLTETRLTEVCNLLYLLRHENDEWKIPQS